MIRLLKIAVLSLSFLFISNWLYAQASVVNNGNFPRHETLDQHTIEVRFDQAITGGPTLPIGDWTVRINTTPVTINSVTRINAFDVAIVFQASDANPGQNFILPGQTVDIRFINISGSLTTLAGGAPANGSGGFINSTNNWTSDCSDFQFKQQGTIPTKSPKICSPVVEDFTQYQFYVSLRSRNSLAWNNAGASISNRINWGDGTTTDEFAYISDPVGDPSPNFIDPTGLSGSPAIIETTRPTHNYPPTLPLTGGDCSWNATITPGLGLGLYIACPGLAQQTVFATYDSDNKNTGLLNLPPSVVNSNRVCPGVNVNMQFTDNTNLNCRLAVEPTVPNQRARNIRITYGSTNYIAGGNIPDIRVELPAILGGATQQITNNDAIGTFSSANFFPSSIGAADGNGVITLNAPVLVSTALTYMGRIFTVDPTKQVVGQRFYIKLEYWDVCNPYDPLQPSTLAAAESIENYIEIIPKPTPLQTAGQSICYLNPNNISGISFTVTNAVATPARTAVRWYNKNPKVGGAVLMTNSAGTNSLTFPASSYTAANSAVGAPFTTNNVNGKYYSVWVTQLVGGTNNCESDPIEVVIFQQPQITTPSTPTGNTNVCNGPPGTAELYSTTAAPIKSIPITTATNAAQIDLTTENVWSHSFGAGVSLTPGTGTSTTVTYNLGTQPNPSLSGNVSALLRYQATTVPVVSPLPAPFTLPTYNIATQACPTSNVNLTVNVFGQSDGGTISPSPTICNGVATGNMNATGTRGAILQWERSYNGGAFVAIAGTAGLTTWTGEVPPNGPGNYKYRVLVQNQNASGPCASATTVVANQNTVTVNPIPPKPTIGASGATTFCDGGSVTLTSSDVGGLAAATAGFQWYKGGTAIPGATSSSLVINTVAQSGSYTVKVIGVSPTNCESPFSDPVLVTVNTLPSAVASGGGSACLGTPASDIVFTFTGTQPFDFTITASTAEPGFPIVITGYTSNTYSIVAPNPATATDYELTSLSDVNGCPSNSLGSPVSVTPQLVPPPSVDSFTGQPDVCDDGASTNPPDAILDLNPNSVQNYAISYRLKRVSTGLFLPATISFAQNSDASGVINISPSYADFGAVPNDPQGYQVVITAIQNVGTGCAGAVPIVGPTLIINPRPAVPTGPVNATACSSDVTGAPLSIADPGAGFEIVWSSAGPSLSAFVAAAPVSGAVSGTNNTTFTPTSTATATYYAFSRNIMTNCISASGRAVVHTRDILPSNVNPDSDNNTANNRTCTSSFVLGASTPINGTGTWTGPAGVTFTPNANSPTATVNNLPLTGGVATITQLTWTVRSTLNVCAPIATFIDITRNPLPDAIDPAPLLCDPGSGSVSGVSLVPYLDAITGIAGSTDRTIQWFSDFARTIAVPDITNVTVITGTKFYNIVTTTSTSCSRNGEITFTVRPLPSAINHSAQICEDTPPGSLQATGIDLTIYESTITGGATNRDVEWYTDPGLAAANLIPAGTATGAEKNYSIAADVTLYAKVIDVTFASPQCSKVATMGLDYQPRPNDNQIRDGNNAVLGASYTICASGSLILLQIDPALNPGASYTWNVPTPVPANQFELLTGVNGFFIIMKFPNAIPSPGIPISVTETLGTAACAGNTLTTSIIVEGSPPKPVISGPSTVCSEDNGILFEVPLIGGSSYSWSLPPGATITSLPVTDHQITVQMSTFSGNVTVIQSSGNGCTSPPADPFPVTVVNRPTITSAPSNTLCSGERVWDVHTLSSDIIGTTYNWQVIGMTGFVGGSLLGDFANGVTKIDQTLTNTSGVTASVTYRVTPIGPTSGASPAVNCSGVPQNFTVTVNPEPSLSLTNKVLCSNEVAGYEIKLAPSNLPLGTTFSWAAPVMSSGSPQGTSGSNVAMGVPGTIHINDSFVNNTTSPITATYTITAQSGLGCVSNQLLSSRQFTVTINPRPLGANDNTPVICSRDNVNYNLQNNIATLGNNLITGTTYSWLAASNGNVSGESLTSQPGSIISDVLRNTTSSNQVVVYTITPTSSGSCVGVPFTVSVTVRPEPQGYDDTTPIFCSDQSLNYDLSVNIANTSLGGNNLTTGTTYTWEAAANSNVTGESVSPQSTGTIGDAITNITNTNQIVVYTVIPTSALGCVGSPFTVSITIQPEPKGFDDGTPIICSDATVNYNLESNILNVGLGGNGLITGTTYSWVATSNSNITGESTTPQSGKIITDVLNNITNADQQVVYDVTPLSANSCPGDVFKITITVHPEPKGFTDNSPLICSDDAVNYSLTGNISNTLNGGNNLTTGTTFTWLAVNNPSVGGESTTSQSGNLISDILNNVTNSNQIVVYTVTPTTNLCVGDPFTVRVTVQPEPKGHDDNTVFVCSNNTLNYNLVANVAATGLGGNNLVTGTTFSWIATSNVNVDGENTIAQSSNIINDHLRNVTNTNQFVVYTVTPSNGSCVGNPFTITITVRPEPKGFNDNSPLACSNDLLNYNLAANVANTGAGGNNVIVGTTFSWIATDNPNTTGESTTSQSGSVINNTIRNTTNTNQLIDYTVTPTSGDGCIGDPFIVSITVRPEPKGYNDTTPATCSDVAFNYDLSSNIANTALGGNNLVSGTTYSWIATSNANVSGESVTAQAGDIITDVLNNITNANQVVVYTVIPTSATGCIGGSFTISVTVSPEPRGHNDNSSFICSDASANYNLTTNITNTGLGGNNLVTGTTFSWVAANNTNVNGESISPQSGSIITDILENVTNSIQVVAYTVTPSTAGCIGDPFIVSINVRPEPQGFDDTTPVICSDAAVNYNLVTNISNIGNGGNNLVTGTTFSWIAASNPNVSGESNVTPGTSSSITDVLNNVTNGSEVVVYTVTPRSSDGCFGNTFNVSVTVRPEPKGFNDTSPFTCSDVALNYDLSANIANTVAGGNNLVAGTTYSWVATPNANVSGESSGVTFTDHITDVLNNVTNTNQVVIYTVTPTSADGCVGNTFTVSVTVRPEPRGFSDNTPVICSDGTLNYDLDANIANTIAGGNNLIAGNTYSWIAVNNPNVSGESSVIPGTGSFINDPLNNVTNTNQVVTYTVTPTSSQGCAGNSFTVAVTIRPEPRGFDDSTPVICSDATVSYDLALNIANIGSGGNNLVTGTTYSWLAADNLNVTGETTGIPGTSQLITDALNNITNSNQIVVYTVTPTSTNGCTGNPFIVNVTVQPEPKGFNDNSPSICSDGQVNYLLNGNIANTVSGGNNLVTGTTYSWLAAANANVSGESTTPQSGNTITDFLNNVTNVNQVVVYTVTPRSANNCFGNPFIVSVTVRPEPKGFSDNTPVICSNATVNYDLVTNISNTVAGGNALTTGTTYSWIAADNPNVTGETILLPVNSAQITDVLVNTSGSNQIVVYTVTPVNGACTGNDFIISVTVRSEPVGNNDNSPTVCSDEAISYNIQTRNINLLGNSVSSTFIYNVVSSDPGNVSVAGKNRTLASNAPITDVYTNLTSSDVIITYTITPFSNPGNCKGSDFNVQFTIHPEPRGPNTAIQICSDDVINYNLQTVINTAVTGNSVPSKFKYSVTSSNASAVAPGPNRNTPSASLINDVYTNTSNSDVDIVYTVTPYSLADDCEGTPFTLTITVHPEPVGQNIVDPVCSTNLNHDIQPSHIINGINSLFTYVVSSTDAIGVPPAANRTVASNSPITDSYTNATGTDVIITYTITPFSVADNCAGSPFTYKVTISSKPVGLSAIKTPVCSDVPFSFDPQNDITNGVISTFTWTAVYNGLTINGTTPPAAGTGVISMALTNLGNADINAVFTILPKSGNCDGATYTITVPVKPEPVVATNLNETKCSGDAYGKLLDTNGTSIGASTYDVTVITKDAGLTGGRPLGLIGTGNSLANVLLTDTYVNTTATPLKVIYSVVPRGTNGCTGDPRQIEFTINPDPVLLVPVPPDICSRSITNIVLGTNGTSINAQTYRLTQIEYSSNAGPFSTAAPADFTFPATNKLIASSGGIDHIKNDVFTNKSAFMVVVRYTIVPVSAGTPLTPLGCEGDPATLDIGVNPEPVLDPALTISICSGDKIDPTGTAFELKSQAGRVASARFIIRSVSFPGMTAGGTNASTNVQILKDDLDNDTYINVNTISLPVTYTIAPISATGCIGEDEQVVITINPAPAIKAGLDRIVCSGSISGIVLQDNAPTSIAAASYNIISITSTGLTADPANATTGITTDVNVIKNDMFINLTNDRIVVTYLVEPISAATCKGPQTAITLTVEPTIVSTSINHNPDICSGTPVDIEFNSPTYSNGAATNPLVTFSYKLQTPIPSGISGYTSGNSLNEGEAIEDVLVNSTNSAITVHYQITPRASAAANGTACQGAAEIIAVIVQPRPKINSIADRTKCENDPINLVLATTTVPSSGVIKFRLTSVVPENAAITGFTPAGVLLSAGTLGDQLSNSDVEQRYVDYTFEPVNVDASDAVICANGIPVTVRVTVNPRPEVTPSASTLEICSSESIEVQLPTDTDQSSTIVKWTALASSLDIVGESAGAGDVLFQTLLNKGNVVQTVDYTITPSFNGCDGPPKHLIVTVNPIPTVTLPNKLTVCAGTLLNINLSPLANTTTNTTFKWEVTDINGIGTPGQFDGTGTAISQSFVNNSDASATLLYQITPIFHGNGTVQCEGIPKIINVSVAPTITAAFVSTDEGVCEGTPVFLTFELHGQSPFDFVYSASDANGTVNKSVIKSGNVKVDKVTPTITTTYRIVSAKDALGCQVPFSPQPEVTITVYQKVTAAWTASIPPFIGGTSVVGFTNTSTPVDGSVFDYDWSFGTDSYVNPLTASGVGPFAVTYTRPGDHYVSLTASNRAAPVELGCESTFSSKITIPVLPLVADFKFDPKVGCFPQTIKITENTATGVAMDWEVKDSNGGIAATSNAPLPEFFITNPGKYTISLRTYDPFTNQEAFAPSAGKDFTIYDNPVASFDVRPTLVYVPDTELSTFNFSTGAPEYLWDFGDGSTSTEQEPKYTYKIEGIYDITLIAINDHGDGAVCRDTLSRKITAKQGGVTKVPNAFTPSLNGPSGGVAGNNTFNDVFLPIVKGAEEFNMQIFDRWGNLIFESNNSNIGWDGYDKNSHLMPAGVYVYKLTVRLSDGQRSTQIGDITMIR